MLQIPLLRYPLDYFPLFAFTSPFWTSNTLHIVVSNGILWYLHSHFSALPNPCTMKRIHLFEFEDFRWFPAWLRNCLTRLIVVMHRILDTPKELAELLSKQLAETPQQHLVDLCSGAGGPMPEVLNTLRQQGHSVDLTLSDLYPHQKAASQFNDADNQIEYLTEPVDATAVPPTLSGLRTMVGSFHHMRPQVAKAILKSAKDSRQPICIFEISDNSYPIWIWWTAIPINFLTCLFITPLVRPMTWQQLVFTYLIPIIPLFFAWDGAVSNARTYTQKDMEILLEGLHAEDYRWEMGLVKGKAKKLYLMGIPL